MTQLLTATATLARLSILAAALVAGASGAARAAQSDDDATLALPDDAPAAGPNGSDASKDLPSDEVRAQDEGAVPDDGGAELLDGAEASASALRAGPRLITLDEEALSTVPGTLGGEPFRAVSRLPGVSTPVSGIDYPVVRGHQPATTPFYLDGVEVPFLYHLFVGPQAIAPSFISSVTYAAQAPSARYGRHLGGAVLLTPTTPSGDGARWGFGVDLLNLEGLYTKRYEGGTEVTLSGRLGWTPWLAAVAANAAGALGDDSSLSADLGDYQLRLAQEIGGGGELRLLAFGSHDAAGLVSGIGNLGALPSATFHRVDLRYTQAIGAGALEAGFTFGLDRLGATYTGAALGLDARAEESLFGVRLDFRYPLDWGMRLNLGVDVERRTPRVRIVRTQTAPIIGGEPGDPIVSVIDTPTGDADVLGLYGQVDWNPTPLWAARFGYRFDVYRIGSAEPAAPGSQLPRGPLTRWAPEPRLSIARRLGESWTLRAAAGIYHQAPTTLIPLPALDTNRLYSVLQQTEKYELAAEWTPAESPWSGSVAVYFNPARGLLELSPFDEREPDVPSELATDFLSQLSGFGGAAAQALAYRQTRGESWGVELAAALDGAGPWFGRASYAFQVAERLGQLGFWAPGLPHPGSGWRPAALSQTHVFDGVAGVRLPADWNLSLGLHFNTGLPELGGLTSRTMTPGTVDGDPAWIASNQVDRLPPFFRIDARVAKRFRAGDLDLELYLDVMNALVTPEVIRYGYPDPAENEGTFERRNGLGLPLILPMLGIKGRI